MKQLINLIKFRLQEKVPALKYIDEDWGQLDYYNPNQPVKWPCVLIDVNQVAWTNEGQHVQLGNASVSIRVADMRLSNSNIKAPQAQRTRAEGILDLLTCVHAALHGWTGDNMNSPLTRLTTRKVNRDDGIREFEVIYVSQITDDSAKILYESYPMTAQKIQIVLETK